jgi:TM2 domain-containing membrane protein YozV
MTGVVCPYCRTNIGAEDEPMICEGCGTVHHANCYAENGGCTIFGCSKAPGDEPKVSVSTPELVAAVAPTALAENRLPPPPPGVVLPAATSQDLRRVANQVVPSMFGGFSAYGDATLAEPVVQPPKNRTSYIILGALLGAFGAHNFYAGYHKKAGIQLAVTVLTLGFGSPMSWVWAVIDICTIDRDGRGVQFES